MEAKDFVDALSKGGMTQSQIADRTGIPQPTISKVSRGDVKDVLSVNYRKLQALYEEVFGSPGVLGLQLPDRRHNDRRGTAKPNTEG